MSKKLYDVLSPDGIPLTCEPFKSKTAALKYIPFWCQRFERQGYYSTSNHRKIPLAELPYFLRIVPEVERPHHC